MDGRYRLIGGIGSPYSIKMRAIMRYRRLPFDWVPKTSKVAEEVAHVRPPMVPVLRFPDDGRYRVDSTFLALELEKRHRDDGRSLIPDDPGDAFLSHLIEDMADEWGAKIMFHYRWYHQRDQDYYGQFLGRFKHGPAPEVEIAAEGARWLARQLSRLPLVGVTIANRAVIEDSFSRVVGILERHFASGHFLFGTRPGLADFGWFGQLSPTAAAPSALPHLYQHGRALLQWLLLMDDLSWVEGAWRDPAGAPAPAVEDFLTMAGDTYLPFLSANAAALAEGKPMVEVEICGRPYAQPPFGYQGKCLGWLRAEFSALPQAARARIDPLLDRTGCLVHLVG